MTDAEAVEAAADAIRAHEASSGGSYEGPTADSIISAHVGTTGRFRFRSRYFELIRRAAERAWGEDWIESKRARPSAETGEERDLRFYDVHRPASRRLDRIDEEVA